jgi:hypothetical protein
MRQTNKIVEFEREFRIPNSDFTILEPKNLKITLEYTTEETNNYIRGSVVGKFHFENAFFKLIIPDYIYNFLLDKKEEFTKDKNFKKTLRQEKLTDLIKEFNKLCYECLFIKQLEDLKKFNKVIFVKSNFFNTIDYDKFNNGLRGEKLNLTFQFFVAYKVIKDKKLIKEYWQEEISDDKIIEYYAVDIHKNRNYEYKISSQLPKLKASELSSAKEIEWTLERELYFKDIENKIKYISNKINDFVNNINKNNVDELISNNTKLLESKND